MEEDAAIPALGDFPLQGQLEILVGVIGDDVAAIGNARERVLLPLPAGRQLALSVPAELRLLGLKLTGSKNQQRDKPWILKHLLRYVAAIRVVNATICRLLPCATESPSCR